MTAVIRTAVKRPVAVRAVRWDWGPEQGTTYEQVRDTMLAWVADSMGLTIDPHGMWHGAPRRRDILGPIVPAPVGVDPYTFVLHIQTLEGRMAALPGDWIIRGVEGEFYPCKPGIFEQTYVLDEH